MKYPDKPTLTPAQTAVLRQLCTGKTAAAVANEFHVSTRTINFHAAGLYRRLGVTSLVQAYNEGMRRGLIEPPTREVTRP